MRRGTILKSKSTSRGTNVLCAGEHLHSVHPSSQNLAESVVLARLTLPEVSRALIILSSWWSLVLLKLSAISFLSPSELSAWVQLQVSSCSLSPVLPSLAKSTYCRQIVLSKMYEWSSPSYEKQDPSGSQSLFCFLSSLASQLCEVYEVPSLFLADLNVLARVPSLPFSVLLQQHVIQHIVITC